MKHVSFLLACSLLMGFLANSCRKLTPGSQSTSATSSTGSWTALFPGEQLFHCPGSFPGIWKSCYLQRGENAQFKKRFDIFPPNGEAAIPKYKIKYKFDCVADTSIVKSTIKIAMEGTSQKSEFLNYGAGDQYLSTDFEGNDALIIEDENPVATAAKTWPKTTDCKLKLYYAKTVSAEQIKVWLVEAQTVAEKVAMEADLYDLLDKTSSWYSKYLQGGGSGSGEGIIFAAMQEFIKSNKIYPTPEKQKELLETFGVDATSVNEADMKMVTDATVRNMFHMIAVLINKDPLKEFGTKREASYQKLLGYKASIDTLLTRITDESNEKRKLIIEAKAAVDCIFNGSAGIDCSVQIRALADKVNTKK